MASLCELCKPITIERLFKLTKKLSMRHTRLYDKDFVKQDVYEHHACLADLERSAGAACILCDFFLQCLRGSVCFDITERWQIADDWLQDDQTASATGHPTLYSKFKELEAKGDPEGSRLRLTFGQSDIPSPGEAPGLYNHITLCIGPVFRCTDTGSVPDDEVSSLSSYGTDTGQFDHSVKLAVTTNQDEPHVVEGNIVGQYPIDLDLGSASNHGLAKSWFHECVANHPGCWPNEDPELPARVIDVGEGTPDSPFDGMRLLCSSQAQTAKYAALSHCWGGKITSVLTTSNLARLQKSIPVSFLPSSFRDAVAVTRNLGIRYLWIDSLCILQDSRNDWEDQARNMGSIYRNASVTILAMVAENSRAGLFQHHPPDGGPSPVQLRVFSDATRLESVTVSRINRAARETLWGLSERSVLSTRAWTLQEWIMSPRYLVYGKRGIYWQCPSHFCDPSGVTGGYTFFPERFPQMELALRPFPPDANDGVPTEFSTEGLLRDYYKIVEKYNTRTLTAPSDKLPAMSAIAQATSDVLESQGIKAAYLAGLWDVDLIDGLLWCTYEGCRSCQSEYRAPSWSWAAYDGPVNYGMFKLIMRGYPKPETSEWDLEVVECNVYSRTSAYPFGEVTSGSLRANGYTLRFIRGDLSRHSSLLTSDGKEFFTIMYDEEMETGAIPQTNEIKPASGEESRLRSLMRSPLPSHPGPDKVNDPALKDFTFSKVEYKALVVRVGPSTLHNGMIGVGIILARPVQKEYYERVGYFDRCLFDEEVRQVWIRETVTII